MSDTLHRICPVCTGSDAEVLHTERFVLPDDHPLTTGYDVLICASCGFVFADTLVSQSDYDRFYATLSKYSDEQTGTGGGHHDWDNERLRVVAETIADFVPDRGAKIVDIGCANGGLLRCLAELGYTRLVGIDPAPACVENTRRYAGVDAHVGTLFDVPEAAGDADCVILSHVMEHVQDLRLATRNLRDLLRPGGTLYIEVPDAASYWKHVTAPFQDFNTEHINHFSTASLTNLVEQFGFRVTASAKKMIAASATAPYPALWIVAEAGAEQSAATGTFIQDPTFRADIERYIERSAAMMAQLADQLEREVDGTPLVVWGTGQTTFKLLAVTALRDAEIAAFVDTSATYRSKRLRGAPILAPAALESLPYPVVVGSLVNRESIREQMAQMGLPNRVVLLDAA